MSPTLGRVMHSSIWRNPLKSKGASHKFLPQIRPTAEVSPDIPKPGRVPAPAPAGISGKVGTCPAAFWAFGSDVPLSQALYEQIGYKHHYSHRNRALPLLQNRPSHKSAILKI